MSGRLRIKVSIVVPVYNAAAYLRECMDSLINQTLKELEIICVDDGSADGSLQILQEYAVKDERISIISGPNYGYGHAVNIGMDTAVGKYIGIVEPDDCVRAKMYNRLYELAEKHDLDMIKADFYRFYGRKNSRKIEKVCLSRKKDGYGKVLDPKENSYIFKAVMNTWAGIYKREFLLGYQIRHHETRGASFQDLGFWFQTLCLAQRVYFLDESLYMYRMDNPGSSVHSGEKAFAVCAEYQFMRDFLEKHLELKKRYLDIYWWKKFHNYQFAMDHIDRKYQKVFLKRFSREFREADQQGELVWRHFRMGDRWMLHRIMYTPKVYLNRFEWYCGWYKVRYYKEHYGMKRTIGKIMETLFQSRQT